MELWTSAPELGWSIVEPGLPSQPFVFPGLDLFAVFFATVYNLLN
jgi:hypothetical protein